MHIILGLLASIITILVLVNRLQENGIDLGWLNPFAWRRRKAFREQYQVNPAFTLSSTMEAAALLMVSLANLPGDISKQSRDLILQLFTQDFHLSGAKAQELLSSSVHLYGNGLEIRAEPNKILSRCQDDFSEQQAQSLMLLMDKVAHAEGEPSAEQLQFIQSISQCFPGQHKLSTW